MPKKMLAGKVMAALRMRINAMIIKHIVRKKMRLSCVVLDLQTSLTQLIFMCVFIYCGWWPIF